LNTKTNPIFDRWHGLDKCIPHVTLGSWPTPLEYIDKLDKGDTRGLWVKREDLSSPYYGGNKVRKLEFLLAASNKPVITFGATGSHHVLATAIHANRCGLSCIGVLVPQPKTPHHDAVSKLVQKHCASTISLDTRALFRTGTWHPSLAEKILRNKGLNVIPPGASSPRGTLGFVAAGIELANQVRLGQCPRPTRIYLPLGTGGTAAGLSLGLGLMGLDVEIRAVRIATVTTGNLTFLNLLARAAFHLLKKAGIPDKMPRLNISIEHNFIGPGYGHITTPAAQAVELARDVGIQLETTYSGKTMAALVADRKQGGIKEPVMFFNTYGPIEEIGESKTDAGEIQR